jgi:hypothetical protein
MRMDPHLGDVPGLLLTRIVLTPIGGVRAASGVASVGGH